MPDEKWESNIKSSLNTGDPFYILHQVYARISFDREWSTRDRHNSCDAVDNARKDLVQGLTE